MSSQENEPRLAADQHDIRALKPSAGTRSPSGGADAYKAGYYYKTSVRRVVKTHGDSESAQEAERDWQARFPSKNWILLRFGPC